MKKSYLVFLGIVLLILILATVAFGLFDYFNKRKISLDSEVIKELDENMNDIFDRKNVALPIVTTTLILFKQEQRAELWVTDQNSKNHLIRTDSIYLTDNQYGTRLYDTENIIPEGIYTIKTVDSDSLSISINFPNAFDVQKQIVDKRPVLTSDIILNSQKGNITFSKGFVTAFLFLAKAAMVDNTIILIIPNDFRHNAPIPNCPTCPPWIAELYGSLRVHLSLY